MLSLAKAEMEQKSGAKGWRAVQVPSLVPVTERNSLASLALSLNQKAMMQRTCRPRHGDRAGMASVVVETDEDAARAFVGSLKTEQVAPRSYR